MQKRVPKTNKGRDKFTAFLDKSDIISKTIKSTSKEDLASVSPNSNPADTLARLKKEHEKLARKILKDKPESKAYKVIFKDYPDLMYLGFSDKKDGSAVRYEACKYYRDNFHPAFMGKGRDEQLKSSKAFRVAELDEYANKKVVPIPILMKVLDMKFPCSICGKGTFTYQSYKNKSCYIVEGEGNITPFAQGYILCYSCHRKYIK